jgi:hypothetical protein
MDEASEFDELFDHGHDNPSVNKGIVVGSGVNDSKLQASNNAFVERWILVAPIS